MKQTLAHTLQSLGLELPAPAGPGANYVSSADSGTLLFLSGQIPQSNNTVRFIGKLGREFSVAEGQQAAQLCALNLIAQIDAAVGGKLERVRRIVRLGGFVNAMPDFENLSEVVNGASDLMVAVFGERGRHARTSVGVATLPLGVAVEVDAVVDLLPE